MKKQNKFEYVKVIQGHFGQGWEDVSEYTKDQYSQIKNDLKEYRFKSEYAYKVIQRRNWI